MKRSDALAPLSREHHVALEIALRLRRASLETAEDAYERFRTFWIDHGGRHFAIEEDLLLGVVPAAAAERLEREHAELRQRATRIRADDVEALNALGGLLRDHVRFEERELFPLVEARLSPEALEALGRRLAAA